MITVFHTLFAILALSAGLLCTTIGMLPNFLFIFLVVSSIWSAVALVVRILKKEFTVLSFQDPSKRILLFQWIAHTLFRVAGAMFFLLCLVPDHFKSSDLTSLYYILATSTIAPVIAEFFPSPRTRPYRLGIHSAVLAFLFVEAAFLLWPGKPAETVTLSPPFKKDFFVLQGGPRVHTNHHYRVLQQQNALDLLPLPYSLGAGKPVTQHSCFSVPIVSPVTAIVVDVLDTKSDQGGIQTSEPAGNFILLEWDSKYLMLAHLKKNSVEVKIGDQVNTGQKLAECGNSGNSTEAHLHIQVQTHPEFMHESNRTIPIRWKGWKRENGGFSPVKNDSWIRRNDRFLKPD